MSDGLSCGAPLGSAALREIHREAVFGASKWNLHDRGRATLCAYPLLLTPVLAARLGAWAVALDLESTHAEAELIERPDLHRRLGLPWRLRAALRGASWQRGARFARFDFHPTTDGAFAITEGNLDVASGLNEGSEVTRLFARHVTGATPLGDPTGMLAATLAGTVAPGATVGCLHLTRYSDDHQVARYVARRLAERGLEPVLFGPSQLRLRRGRAVALVGAQERPLDAVFRFLPADWLSRLPVASRWWRAFAPSGVVWANPPSSVLTQTKRFPLVWPAMETPMPTWRRLLPETRCPREARGDGWVLKPSLGHEGYRVGIVGVTPAAALATIATEAARRPDDWVAQRRFSAAAIATPDGDRYPTLGVWVVDGRVAGLYGRLSARPLIDDSSQDVVLLVTS